MSDLQCFRKTIPRDYPLTQKWLCRNPFSKFFEAPLRHPCPHRGRGRIRFLWINEKSQSWVILHYRDWGATAAGQSPWSVIRKEVFYRAPKNIFFYPSSHLFQDVLWFRFFTTTVKPDYDKDNSPQSCPGSRINNDYRVIQYCPLGGGLGRW